MNGERFELIETPMAGLHLIQRAVLGDQRGSLSRLFCPDDLAMFGWQWPVAQVNHSYSRQRGTVRGLHMQMPPHSEAKLVTCLRGAVWDVAVDLREGSKTFLQWQAVRLSSENACSYLIPPGFAHGFQTLTDDAELLYCHSHPYVAEAEFGVHYREPKLEIPWPMPVTETSRKDRHYLYLPQEFTGFNYEMPSL